MASADDSVRKPSVEKWVDLDRPGVVSLRQRLIPPPDGNYRLIAASVTEDLWLADIPCDRPTCIVAEGLLPWLTPEQGTSMIRRFVEYFPRGQMEFDAVGCSRCSEGPKPSFAGASTAARSSRRPTAGSRCARSSGATSSWGKAPNAAPRGLEFGRHSCHSSLRGRQAHRLYASNFSMRWKYSHEYGNTMGTKGTCILAYGTSR
ncbi:hypothetical protein GGR56DRAFT_467814 [Xylariaceae sp. FL0804]|nr:hypothetical protein GGR56DRAFT_467814 [Xylariaceae sp. FL0804]